MENLYALVSDDTHECKIWNLVWSEASSSYSIYNIYKNNVESRHQFKEIKEFELYLDGLKQARLISNYYNIKL